MNREDIIRMAREADREWDCDRDMVEWLEWFAALVAAAEREKVARWQIGSGYATGHGDTIEDLLVELEWQVREAEREECIDIVAMHGGSVEIEAAIRARGQAAKTCPPCHGDCNQGRTCPARGGHA